MDSIQKTHVIVKIAMIVALALVFAFTSTPAPASPIVQSQTGVSRSILWTIDGANDSEARVIEVSYA